MMLTQSPGIEDQSYSNCSPPKIAPVESFWFHRNPSTTPIPWPLDSFSRLSRAIAMEKLGLAGNEICRTHEREGLI